MAFYERRSSRNIIRYWRARRARIKKAEADEAKRQRALAKEAARQEREAARQLKEAERDEEEPVPREESLRIDIDDEDANSDAMPVSPIRSPQGESEVSEEEGQTSPSHAGVGANLRYGPLAPLPMFRLVIFCHAASSMFLAKRCGKQVYECTSLSPQTFFAAAHLERNRSRKRRCGLS